jgi:hypothetical protein
VLVVRENKTNQRKILAFGIESGVGVDGVSKTY